MSPGLVAPYREIRSYNGRIKRTEEALQKAGQKSGGKHFQFKNFCNRRSCFGLLLPNFVEKRRKGIKNDFHLSMKRLDKKISNVQQGMSKVQGNIQCPTRNVQGPREYPISNKECPRSKGISNIQQGMSKIQICATICSR